MNVHRDDEHLAPMGISRTRRQPPYGDGRTRRLAHASAASQPRATQVTPRLKEMEARASALAEMSDRALVALVLTDACGRVAGVEPARRAPSLPENDCLLICATGRLAGRAQRGRASCSRLIQEAAGSRAIADERRHAGCAPVRPPAPRACPLADPQRCVALRPLARRLDRFRRS